MRDRPRHDYDRQEGDRAPDTDKGAERAAQWARMSGRERIRSILDMQNPPEREHPAADKRRVPAAIQDIFDKQDWPKPSVGDTLPRPERLAVDRQKFAGYLLNPEHPRNIDPKTGGNKTEAWKQLGYDLTPGEGRERSTDAATEQLRQRLPDARIVREGQQPYGHGIRAESPWTGPNGQSATAVTNWQRDTGTANYRLTTMWMRVDRPESEGQ